MNIIISLLFLASLIVVIRAQRVKKKRRLQELNATLTEQSERRKREQAEKEKDQVTAAVKQALASSIIVSSTDYSENNAASSVELISESRTCWVPPGHSTEVAGYKLSSGMVYVGSSLVAVSGYGSDAALLDPTKPIDVEDIDREGKSMGYWPSYSDIPPGNRAAYLEWLANGRRDPGAYIGYVFLFLYGLERRLLFDINYIDEVKTEMPVLVDEVKALIHVYGKVSGSFNNYATGLIDALNLSSVQGDYTQATPPTTRSGWDFPRELKLALGTLAQEGKPVPVEWALSWVRCCPEAQLRTPAIRCAAEFDALFAVRYSESFADGLRIKPTKSRLKESHRPASPSLPSIEIALPDLPDVTKLSAPIQQLMKIVESVQLELEQYSRIVGQGKERRGVAALATLPAKIQPSELSGDAKAIIELIEKRMAQAETVIIPSSELIERYNVKTLGKLTKPESILLADFLAKRGYGIEPDTRFGGVNLSSTSHCAIYRVNDVDVEPGSAFKSATVLLHLSVAMVKADGDVTVDEQRHLELHMEQALQLKTAERKRLSAHLQWLMADSPSLTSVKHRIQELEESQRRSLAQFLISVAGADGHISSSEIKILSKIYPLLGLEPNSVYGDVHSLSVADSGLVTVQRPDGPSKGFAIPKQQLQDADPTIGTIVLDTERIARIREKSLEASSLLNSVFDENQSDISDASVAEIVADENIYASGVLSGLDAKHSAFVRILMERDSWSRADVERLAQQHDLLTAGAIEAINEASFNVCGEALLECDDPIEVNAYAKKEILK